MTLQKNLKKARELLIKDKLNKIKFLRDSLAKANDEDEPFDDVAFFKFIKAHDKKYNEAKAAGKDEDIDRDWEDMYYDMIRSPNIPTHAVESIVGADSPWLKTEALYMHNKAMGNELFTGKQLGDLVDSGEPDIQRKILSRAINV